MNSQRERKKACLCAVSCLQVVGPQTDCGPLREAAVLALVSCIAAILTTLLYVSGVAQQTILLSPFGPGVLQKLLGVEQA